MTAMSLGARFAFSHATQPRELLAAILEHIQRFAVSPPLMQRGWCGDRTKAGDSWGKG